MGWSRHSVQISESAVWVGIWLSLLAEFESNFLRNVARSVGGWMFLSIFQLGFWIIFGIQGRCGAWCLGKASESPVGERAVTIRCGPSPLDVQGPPVAFRAHGFLRHLPYHLRVFHWGDVRCWAKITVFLPDCSTGRLCKKNNHDLLWQTAGTVLNSLSFAMQKEVSWRVKTWISGDNPRILQVADTFGTQGFQASKDGRNCHASETYSDVS